jgi:hypothetical protein
MIVGGLFIVALALLIASQSDNSKTVQQPVARLELNLGQVSVLRKNLTQKEVVSRKAPLYPMDSIETGPDGDATLEFDSAYRIRLLENSIVTVDQEGERAVIIIKRGDVSVENHGREGSVFISRDGTRWAATDYELNYKKQGPAQSLPDLPPAADAPPAERTSSENLTATQIQDTLNGQRSSFFKCYTQLLQKTPGVVGQISIHFTILNSGKVSQSEISSTTISDDGFKKCLIEAMKRVEFKSFSGEPISGVFPLRFE